MESWNNVLWYFWQTKKVWWIQNEQPSPTESSSGLTSTHNGSLREQEYTLDWMGKDREESRIHGVGSLWYSLLSSVEPSSKGTARILSLHLTSQLRMTQWTSWVFLLPRSTRQMRPWMGAGDREILFTPSNYTSELELTKDPGPPLLATLVWVDLRRLFTPRIPQFISPSHNMAI